MKKLVLIILAGVISLSLIGCRNTNPEKDAGNNAITPEVKHEAEENKPEQTPTTVPLKEIDPIILPDITGISYAEYKAAPLESLAVIE